jgi:hypothetical protein
MMARELIPNYTSWTSEFEQILPVPVIQPVLDGEFVWTGSVALDLASREKAAMRKLLQIAKLNLTKPSRP